MSRGFFSTFLIDILLLRFLMWQISEFLAAVLADDDVFLAPIAFMILSSSIDLGVISCALAILLNSSRQSTLSTHAV